MKGLLTEGFFWIPSLGGPTTIAARQSGSGISWLFPFVVLKLISLLTYRLVISLLFLRKKTDLFHLRLTLQTKCAGWSSSIRLAWHNMLSCVACATCCFPICLYGDNEATPGEYFPVYTLSLSILPIVHCRGLTWSVVCYRAMTRHRRTHCSFWNFFHLWLDGSLCLCHQDCPFIGMCISLFSLSNLFRFISGYGADCFSQVHNPFPIHLILTNY